MTFSVGPLGPTSPSGPKSSVTLRSLQFLSSPRGSRAVYEVPTRIIWYLMFFWISSDGSRVQPSRRRQSQQGGSRYPLVHGGVHARLGKLLLHHPFPTSLARQGRMLADNHCSSLCLIKGTPILRFFTLMHSGFFFGQSPFYHHLDSVLPW